MDIKEVFGGTAHEKKPFKFWVRCPKCKKSFGIPPLYVLKFIKRATNENPEELKQTILEIAKGTANPKP